MFSNYLALYKKDFQSVARGPQSGFGLIELMVSISIMTIVSSIILVGQNSFNSAVLLRNQTYDVALSAREIQLSALTSGDSAGDFRAVLGLHFDTNPLRNDRYIIFKDNNNNFYYDAGEEFGIQDILDNRFEVRAIRLGTFAPAEASVIFERPNFDAHFYIGPNNKSSVEAIEIDIARRGTDPLANTDDVLRTLEITSTGQITVQ